MDVWTSGLLGHVPTPKKPTNALFGPGPQIGPWANLPAARVFSHQTNELRKGKISSLSVPHPSTSSAHPSSLRSPCGGPLFRCVPKE